MSDPRRIVLILGNGYDLDRGLKTSYKDFWESEYCPKDYPAPLIRHLNSRWEENKDAVRWYDLENELHSYAQEVDKKDIIDAEDRNFINSHSDYELTLATLYTGIDKHFSSLYESGIIKIQESRKSANIPYRSDLNESAAWRDRKAFVNIKEGLCNYLKSIDNHLSDGLSVAGNVLLAMTKAAQSGDKIDIFTFNYTRVQMHGFDCTDIPVHYMHGCCEDGKIIVGTRDDLSIDTSYDFLLKAMDDSFNPPDIVSALNEADEVIVFGHSLGENDRQYFAPFFLRRVDYSNPAKKGITIFTQDSRSKNEIKRALQKMTDGNLSALYSINQPNIIRTAKLCEDQTKFLSFLVDHHTDEHFAQEIIGKLISERES